MSFHRSAGKNEPGSFVLGSRQRSRTGLETAEAPGIGWPPVVLVSVQVEASGNGPCSLNPTESGVGHWLLPLCGL